MWGAYGSPPAQSCHRPLDRAGVPGRVTRSQARSCPRQGGARSPEVVVAPLEADATVAHTVRHAIVRSVARILCHDPGVRLVKDPEDVHQLRVDNVSRAGGRF